MKVLVVDDDLELLDLMSYALRREGYDVLAAPDGQQALHRCQAESPDMILLDVNLPKTNGFEVLRQIRESSEVPVVMLTARDDEPDIIRALQMGADDYVCKPFSARQLVARIKAVLRRCRSDRLTEASREVRVGDLVLDLESHQATRHGTPVQLTRLEFRILYMLALNKGRVIPYSRLIEYAWGYYGDSGSSNLLKTHICHIRQKVGLPDDDPARGIKVVQGVGYRLAA
jgi:DNA-binding response OmpR family regulator